ncbi:hypothetical protein IscW_ISCW010387 [Ixodes scapularis]|uniref:Uncharacterized protein n=1 Tax=Ixodes scapularis TaxID=6945 RepID=B7Q7D8_IXOSC|nr:hypothetical protein IscW_ISCW010387 [Ixodes scapularis]|eukprot:XP_002403918.1 hypothetical protein IscW_ISCW010387 [Ixodes scapularis]
MVTTSNPHQKMHPVADSGGSCSASTWWSLFSSWRPWLPPSGSRRPEDWERQRRCFRFPHSSSQTKCSSLPLHVPRFPSSPTADDTTTRLSRSSGSTEVRRRGSRRFVPFAAHRLNPSPSVSDESSR